MSIKESYPREYQAKLSQIVVYMNTEHRYVYIRVPFAKCLKYIYLKVENWKPCSWYDNRTKRQLFTDLFQDAAPKIANKQIGEEFKKYSEDGIIDPLYDLINEACRTQFKEQKRCCLPF